MKLPEGSRPVRPLKRPTIGERWGGPPVEADSRRQLNSSTSGMNYIQFRVVPREFSSLMAFVALRAGIIFLGGIEHERT